MDIDDLIDLIICNKCGICFDKFKTKQIINKYGNGEFIYICPFCKTENEI